MSRSYRARSRWVGAPHGRDDASPKGDRAHGALLRREKLDARRGLQPAPGHRPEAHCLAQRKQGRRLGFAAGEWRRRWGRCIAPKRPTATVRSEEHTSELQSIMRISYAVLCLKKKKPHIQLPPHKQTVTRQWQEP